MSSGGYRERGFGPQGRFEVSPGPTKTDGSRQTPRSFTRGTFNPQRRNDRPQIDVWATSNPQSFYHQNNPQTQHNSSQSWQNRGRFQGNLRQPFRGTSNYSSRGSRGSFNRTSGFRFPNGRGHHQNQDHRWRLPNRDFQQSEKPEEPGPPLLGSEEERQQKITDAVDELKRKFLCNDGPTEELNLWDDDFNIPGPEPDDEATPRGIPELRHGPPEITLTTSDLKDIGRVDIDIQKSTDIRDDPDCEIIDVAKSVKTFSEITIHDSGESPIDFNDDNPDLQKNIPGNDDFTNDEYFDKSPKNDDFNKNNNIGSNIEETGDKKSPEDDKNIPDAPEKPEKSTEDNKSKPKESNTLKISSPTELSHTFAPPQRREPSPDDFIDRNLSKRSKKRSEKESRGWPVELAPDTSKSPIKDLREAQKSSKNLNFPQKISVNINRPPETSFTPPLPPSRSQMMDYDIPQPAPAFDPRRQSNDLQMSNLIHDYGIMCPGGYPMAQMMNIPSMEYNMTPGYGPINPYVPMNYPPVIPSLDYSSPMAPSVLNNLNTPLNTLNQIPLPSNPHPNEDDALRELRRAMEFAEEIMAMGNETDDIKFKKECENGFDNFPTLPDLPPPPPPLPVPPEDDKKSKSKEKKNKQKRKDSESTSLPPVSEILESAMAAAAAASSKSSIPTSSPSTTPPPKNMSISIKEELTSPIKEDRQKVTFNLSLKSKKINQCPEWGDNDISTVPEDKLKSFLPSHQQKPKESSSSSVSTSQVAEKPEKSVKMIEKSEMKIGKVEEIDNSSFLEMNPPKKLAQTLDLNDLLKSTQFDSSNLLPISSSTTPRPSHTPDTSDPTPTPSTSKKPQSSTWKDRVIGRFLRMSKNDIKNMINNSNLRKFDIAMQHLVKEKKSSLSLEMRNTEDERIKNRDNTYDKEDFIHQLKQILDPAATVDISDLPNNFIHQLNEVLQLDVIPNDDNTNSTTIPNQEAQNPLKIDQLYQNHNSSLQMFGINAPGDTFKLSKIDIPVSKDSTKSLAILSESTVTQRHAKRKKNSIINDNQFNQQLNSPESSVSSQLSGLPDTGALIMDELDDIFSAGINRGKILNKIPPSVKQSSTFEHNCGNNNKTVDRFTKRSMKNDEHRISRCRKNSSDLDFFRNLTKEEYDARYGESSHSSHDNPYRIMNPKLCKKFNNDQINGDSDQEQSKLYQSPVSRNNYSGDSSSSSSDDGSDDYDSGSSTGSSDESSDEPSIDVSRMLRFIKEREKIAKKKSLNEEIRDEVTAEIERKRREKRAHREHRDRSRKKDKKGKSRRIRHRKSRSRKKKKKKRRRSHHSGDDNQSFERSLPILDVQDIKREPEDVELSKESSPQVQRKRLIGPKSVMAKAALMQQEQDQEQEQEQEKMKSLKIHSPSILGPKPTLNSTSGFNNKSPITGSPSRNSPAHSSPNSSGSTNSQSINQLLKTKAQLKQMPEGIKKAPEGLDRRGPCTPPLQVRPMTELLKKSGGDCGSEDHSDVPGKIATAVPPVWGQFYHNFGTFGKCLDRNEGIKSPLRVAEPAESARFTFLQRNKLVDSKEMSLSPLIGDNLSFSRVDEDRRSVLEVSSRVSGASGSVGGADGVKGTTSGPKKLDFKAYQERALQRRLRAEGKLPPLLEKIDHRISGSDRGSLRTLCDDVASPANSSPPVLVEEIITKDSEPSGDVRVKNQQIIGDKSSEIVEKVSVKVQSPGTNRKMDNVRSTPGPLSSKRRKNIDEIGRKEDDVSPPASEINSPSQREDTLEKSKQERDNSSRKGKISLKRGNDFSFYFRLCRRIVSDGLPDIVPAEGLPETRVEDYNLQYGERSGETGEIATKLVEISETLDSVEKMGIDDEIGEKLPELHSGKALGSIKNNLEASGAPEEPVIPEVSSINTLEPLKSSDNEEKLSTISPELHKNEEINSLDLLEAPVTQNNESKLHLDSSGPTKSPFVSVSLENCLPRVTGDFPGIPGPPKSSEDVHSTPQRLPEDIPSLESSISPRNPQNSGIENLKEADLNERNDLASLKADEATWRIDSNHLDELQNPPNIHNTKEEVSFTESQTNWQLEAEISTEESRKNVVLHDRALVVDTPRNSLLDDPIAFATSNNSPVNDGETADEFGILCNESIYANHLVESSIDGINDSSVPMRTSYTPDNEFIGDLNDDEGLDQIDQVGILDRELLEVGRKGSPVGLPTLILQGMVRDDDDGVKSPREGGEGSIDVPDAAGDVKIDTEEVKTPGGEDEHAKIDRNGTEIIHDDSRARWCDDGDKSIGKGGDTGVIGDECDKTLQEAEKDIKELQEAEETITAPGGSEGAFKILETSDKSPEICLHALEPEPEMQILAPEDVENSLNSLATEKSQITQSMDISSLGFSSKIDVVDTPKAPDAPDDDDDDDDDDDNESLPKSLIIREVKPEILNQSESPNLPENNQNKPEIDDSSSSRPSPTSWVPSPTPSEPSPLPGTSKAEEKSKLKDVETSKKHKDIDSLRKLNKSSTPNREHKKNKHHDKKKMKITGKMVAEAIKSATVVVSKPKTKDQVIDRMQKIDLEIQKLMNEKMRLYQLMLNDEWPIPEAEVPEPAPAPTPVEEKPKVKANNSGDKSIAKKTQRVVVPRVPDAPHVSDHSPSISGASEGTSDVIKPQKIVKNDEKRWGNWEDKIPLNKAKKRAHSRENISNEGVKSKEVKRENTTEFSRTKIPDDLGNKKDKKSKNHEEITKKPVKLSQLIGRDFKPKVSSQKGKTDDKCRDNRDKSVEKSSIKHKNSSGHVDNHDKRENSEIIKDNAKSDEKKKKKKSRDLSMENQGLFYSDESTLDSVDRNTGDQRRATGLALLEESMKREVGMKKKENSRKLKDSTPEDDNIDISKLSASSLKKKHSQKKGKKSMIPEASGGPKGSKYVQESMDTGVKNRGTKKPQKTDKIHDKSTQDAKKKSSEDLGKSQDQKIIKNETKLSKKIDTKLNLIDSDSSDDDSLNTGVSSSRSHVKTPSKRLEDSSDEKERNKGLKKSDKTTDSKLNNLKNEILDDWSDSSSDSLKLQKDKKTSKVSKSIIDDSEDDVKNISSTEKSQKSKINDSKTSKSSEKRSKSGISDKLKSSSKDSDKKSSSKDSDKSKVVKEVEKLKKEDKVKISSRNGEDSPIEGDDEDDDDISMKRKGTSKRNKKISRRSNKSSSRSRSRSKRALRSSSRDSSLDTERIKKRRRSESSTSSRNSRRKSFTSRTEPHSNKHKRRQKFGEKSREEMMNCRVKLVDCKYLLSLRPEEHPQVFKRLGISRINSWKCTKFVEMSDDKDRSEDDYHSMIVVEVDDNVESSSAVELIEEGIDYGEDNISEKSVCLGFPVSPRADELIKERVEGVKEGASEGDVEMIEIKEEPIMRADSRTGEGLGDDDPEEVGNIVEVNEGQVEGDSEEEGEDKDRMRYTVHKGPILDIKVFGDSFLAASEDGAIYRYSQKSNGILNIYQGHEAAVTCLYVHEIPGITESKKWYLFSGSLDASLRCYDVMGGILNRPKVTVGSPIQCMDEAWGTIFIGTKSGHISRYDIKTGSLREDKLDFSDKPVLALRASTEGPRKILIVASRNQPITIRDAISGLFLRTIAGQRTHTVYSLMRDRNLVYCGTSSTSIPVFDFISGEQVTQFTAGVGIVCMRLYRQLLFAGCYDGNIYVFDTKEPKLICSIPGPGNMLLSMEIVDDTIIAGSKDRRLHAWRMPPSVRTMILERT